MPLLVFFLGRGGEQRTIILSLFMHQKTHTSGGAVEDVGTVNVCCSAFIMNHNTALMTKNIL
jgi:hypothetical protein